MYVFVLDCAFSWKNMSVDDESSIDDTVINVCHFAPVCSHLN